MRFVFGYFLLALLSSTSLCAQSNWLSSEQVESELFYTREMLLEAHFNPFLNNRPERIDSAFQFARNSIGSDSLSRMEVYRILQRFISNLRNGHTGLAFPIQEYIQYAQAGGGLFPLELTIDQDEVTIRQSYTDNPDLQIGQKVLSINGIPIRKVLKELGYYMPAEDAYFMNAKMEALSFPRLYWLVHGAQELFTVKVELENEARVFELHAVPVIDGFERRREEVLNASMLLEVQGKAALLNPGAFGGDFEVYKTFIDSAFTQIVQSEVEVLYIDLRNNPGGDDAFSDYMVSYMADRPFYWCRSFYLRSSRYLKDHVRRNSDTTSAYAHFLLNMPNGAREEFHFEVYEPQPEVHRFKGEVYVLINRQTHSQAAVTAAQISDYEWGTTLGETTGEHPTLMASLFPVTLPETGFVVQVSKGFIVRVDGDQSYRGLLPDEPIELPMLKGADLLNWLINERR